MTAVYQVVAECAHATVIGPLGKAVHLLMKGALVDPNAPELKRLIDIGFVAKIGGETGGINADGVPAGAFETDVPVGVTSTPVPKSDEQVKADAEAAEKSKADDEVSRRRAEARGKLPEDGSVPKGTAGKDTFVEYLAARGWDYDELMKQDKADLVEMAKTA